jgi:predicted nucleic-acid-binding Zn-ribbon protein
MKNKNFICPKCGGELIFNTELKCCLPAMYHHKCNKCTYSKDLYEKNNFSTSRIIPVQR